LAPTNLAASLYHGARTIHSFFYGVLDDLDEGYQNPQNLLPAKTSAFRVRLSGVRMFIIDEISMVRADLFEMMNQICQKAMILLEAVHQRHHHFKIIKPYRSFGRALLLMIKSFY
jgi:hypothetical protein